ncbi:nuclear speckle splicing regulatory protein 1 isoform 2-T2 [Anomaloglossus baeobatrachus]|uniref:nuclear speckle splicing regulatory protein 1 isoform X2 n=1 Tax=Anomaloglossus baeobatrachus TaxID=238106 RepID=UPI003F503A1B
MCSCRQGASILRRKNGGSRKAMSVGETLQKEALKKRAMKQTKLEMQKALEEDASVYEYDSVYDDLQKKKEDNAAKMLSGKDRKPKYIQNILKAVEHRKKEQEKRMEKKIQKEREMEGEEFQDKEAFVTTAYKKKLQEKAEEEERERREAAIEASLDVTKQKDLSGFYRHLLNQTVGEEKTPECSLRSTEVKQEKPRGYSDESINRSQEDNIDADSDLETESSDDQKDSANKSSQIGRRERKTHYRRRHTSSSSEEDDNHRYKEKSTKTSGKNRIESSNSQRRDCERVGTQDFEERTRHKEHSSKDWERRGEDQDYEEREHGRSKRDGKREKEHLRREVDEYYIEKDSKKHKERIDEGKRRDRADKDQDLTEREHRKRQDRHRSDRDRTDRLDRDRIDREHTDNTEQADRDQPERENRHRAERDHTDRREREYQGKTESKLEEGPDKVEIHKGLEIKGEIVSSCEAYQPDEMEKDSDLKRKVEEASQDGKSSTSKFAKRNNEETVISARDRYLARQIARAAVKTYVEKEED